MNKPTYKGNAGHLMQHWTLCEILETAGRHTTGLNFIDAHAMAPLATENRGKDAKFQSAENRLPNLGDSASAYDRAWRKLTSKHHPTPEGYPNSAAFVEQVWKGDFSLLLCEIDRATCAEIEPWLRSVDNSERCKATELSYGDWRSRFEKGLPSPAGVGLSNGSLTLVSFDPNMCGRKNVVSNRWWNIYPKDIQLAMHGMKNIQGGILIQLPTYTANGGNRQKDVIASMSLSMEPKGFTLLGVVRIDGHMMSLMYARNIPWAAELRDLPGRFNEWFSAIYPSREAAHLRPERGKAMTIAQLTRADASVTFECTTTEWDCRQHGICLVDYAPDTAIRGRQRYEIRLVKDTSDSSPGYPWAVFCPALDLISAGSTPCDALEMIADAVNEALTDGAIPGYCTDNGTLDALYQELVQAGLPTAEAAIWMPDPGDDYARRTR